MKNRSARSRTQSSPSSPSGQSKSNYRGTSTPNADLVDLLQGREADALVQSTSVRIKLGSMTNDQFVTGILPASNRVALAATSPLDLREFDAIEAQIRASGLRGGLIGIPFGGSSPFGPRLSAQSGEIFLRYERCEIPAIRANGSSMWQPEIVNVQWRATTRRGTTGSGTVAHFADLEVARNWAQYAKALANDEYKLAILNYISPNAGQAGLEYFIAQHEYVYDCFHAIAQFFNSLNIPWYTHPASRDLYRRWLAGRFAGGDSVLFNPRTDYNEQHWYSKAFLTDERDPLRIRPLLTSPTPDERYGIIPREIREKWNRFGSKPGENDQFPIEFRQRAGIALKKLDGRWLLPDNDAPVDYQDNVLNEAFVIPFSLDFNAIIATGRAEPATLPRDRMLDFIARLDGGDVIDEDRWGNTASVSHRIGRVSDWRTYAWDDRISFGFPPWQAAAPLEMYLRWAREWADIIAAADPAQVLSDSRVNVIRTNFQWTESLGPEGFNRAASTADTRAEREGKGSDVLSAVSALTGVTSSAIPVVGSIIGGVVSGGLNLINQFVRTGPPRSTSRDDLGRWKPKFERAYLGGDPLSTVPAEGVPLHRVATLPGFCRTKIPVPPSDLPPEQEPPNRDGPPDRREPDAEDGESPSAIRTVAVVALGLAAIGGGYALYLQSKKGRGKP